MAYLMKMHKTKGTMIGRYKVKAYDSGPNKGSDRYTICCDGGENGDRHVYAANSQPFHPAFGIGQFVGTLYYEDWTDDNGVTHREYGYRPTYEGFGRLIAWDSLPDDVKKFVELRLKDDEV